MILSELVNDAYLTYRGKTSNVPVAGSEKYTRILMIANRKQREWAQDPNVDWISRFELLDGGVLASGTQEYDLDETVIRLSDYIILTDVNGAERYVKVVKPQLRTRYLEGVYLSGGLPKRITFIQAITDDLDGFALTVPCFTMPDDLVNPSDEVAVDNPQWLVYAVAAELARNDYAKEEQYSNIIGQANDLYAQMAADSQANSFLQPNGVVNNMPQYNGLDYNVYNPWRTL